MRQDKNIFSLEDLISEQQFSSKVCQSNEKQKLHHIMSELKDIEKYENIIKLIEIMNKKHKEYYDKKNNILNEFEAKKRFGVIFVSIYFFLLVILSRNISFMVGSNIAAIITIGILFLSVFLMIKILNYFLVNKIKLLNKEVNLNKFHYIKKESVLDNKDITYNKYVLCYFLAIKEKHINKEFLKSVLFNIDLKNIKEEMNIEEICDNFVIKNYEYENGEMYLKKQEFIKSFMEKKIL